MSGKETEAANRSDRSQDSNSRCRKRVKAAGKQYDSRNVGHSGILKERTAFADQRDNQKNNRVIHLIPYSRFKCALHLFGQLPAQRMRRERSKRNTQKQSGRAENSKQLHSFIIIVSILLLAAACGKDSLSEVLIIPKEAKELDRIRFRGMDQMTYDLKETFPAAETIRKISEPLKKAGWEPLRERYLEPGVLSSHISGWKYYEDHRVGSDSFVYEWTTSWKDKNNNVITYTLQYRDPIEKYQRSVYILKPGSSNLKVMAVYMPEKVARAMRENAERTKSRS